MNYFDDEWKSSWMSTVTSNNQNPFRQTIELFLLILSPMCNCIPDHKYHLGLHYISKVKKSQHYCTFFRNNRIYWCNQYCNQTICSYYNTRFGWHQCNHLLFDSYLTIMDCYLSIVLIWLWFSWTVIKHSTMISCLTSMLLVYGTKNW